MFYGFGEDWVLSVLFLYLLRRVSFSKNGLLITYFMLSRTAECSKNNIQDTVEEEEEGNSAKSMKGN